MSALLAKLKANPVTTVLGLLAAASGWLSTQPLLDGHPGGKQLLQVAGAGFLALLGAFSADAPKS